MKNKSLCVIGLGYIGLPTAALLANKGFSVVGVDINEKVVSTINEGKIHIVEAGLDAFVKSAVSKGQLKAFIEVKNVTLSRKKGIAEFPDAITSRGLKHIKELIKANKKGYKIYIIYLMSKKN